MVLLSQAAGLFARLDQRQPSTLLQIIFSRIIVSPNGEIINYELNAPFATIYKIAVPPPKKRRSRTKCSEQINSGPFVPYFTELPTDDVGQFLSMLKFEQRGRLAELGVALARSEEFESLVGIKLDDPGRDNFRRGIDIMARLTTLVGSGTSSSPDDFFIDCTPAIHPGSKQGNSDDRRDD